MVGRASRLTIALFAAAWGDAAEPASYRLALSAATVERAGQLIEFTLPADVPANVALRDANGTESALQVDTDRTARFVVTKQKPGETLVYTLGSAGVADRQQGVTAARDGGELRLKVGGRQLLAYRMHKNAPVRAGIEPKFKRAGYVHPVLTPSGQLVTDDSPSNHAHHHAIWFAWSATKFQGRAPNFWELGEQKGTVEFVSLERAWSGPVHGGFVSRQRMIDLVAVPPVGVLDETWQVTAYNLPDFPTPVWMFDLVSTQSCATGDPLLLAKYRYGGFGFRGAGAWDGRGNLRVLTSEGETERDKANAARARWCYLGSAAGGAGAAGVALLGHPDNFRAPQPLRIHPEMPFLNFAPSQLGDFAIEPGRPLVGRYRILTLDGAPDRALFEAYWQGYAHPASVRVERMR